MEQLFLFSGTSWSIGNEPIGFTETLYASSGLYKIFGGGISGWHSSVGFGGELDTGIVLGKATGLEIGYTSQFHNW